MVHESHWFNQAGILCFSLGFTVSERSESRQCGAENGLGVDSQRGGLQCRWHDLRHTVCTKMAENGVPESTMLSIMGHMSRKMLERYSHIRMAAKRQAVEALRLFIKIVFLG